MNPYSQALGIGLSLVVRWAQPPRRRFEPNSARPSLLRVTGRLKDGCVNGSNKNVPTFGFGVLAMEGHGFVPVVGKWLEVISMTDPRIRAFSCLMSGLAVGIAVAGLFAPRSGAATRKLVQRKAQKAKRLVKTTIDDGNRYITRRGTEALDKASELISRGKEAYHAAMEKMAPAAL